MAVQTITYDDKQYLNQNSDIADVNKCNDTDLNEIKSVVNNNANELTNIIGKKLWTNSNPNNPFPNNTDITLSNGNYDELEILFKDAYDQQRIYSQKILKGYSTLLQVNHSGGSDLIYHRYRTFTYNNDTSYTFGAGKQLPTNSSTVDTNASYIIPICIIGYNTGLFN